VRPGTAARIALRKPLRERYWALRKLIDQLGALRRPAARPFARVLLRDWVNFALGMSRPVEGQIRERAEGAIGWLLRAQQATPDDGVSLGYFPCHPAASKGWLDSYPETTGYIIPTLLEWAHLFQQDEVRDAALRIAA
jgi:hypothetical protein